MRVMVTGGGGFLGRYVVEQLLERGDDVSSLSRNNYPALEKQGVRCFKGSLTDFPFVVESFKDHDAVIHVAARAGFWGKKELFWPPNVTGTENTIKACRENGIRKLVFTSSPSVVFSNDAQRGADESLPYPSQFESAYPESKAMSEKMVLAANGHDLMTCSLRPHLIFGPRDPHLLPKLLSRAASGKLIQVGDGQNRVDLTYVEDAARAHLLALDQLEPGSPVCGSAYFISQDEPVNLWNWIGDLLRQLELQPVPKKISLTSARFIGGTIEIIYKALSLKGDPRLTRFLASELAKDHYYNISKAKNELGYQPEYNMESALEKTIPFLMEFLAHK